MDKKTLLTIRVPAVDKSFDFWIPDHLSIDDVTKLVQELILESEHRLFKASAAATLYLEADGLELDLDNKVSEYAFVDGTRLVLI